MRGIHALIAIVSMALVGSIAPTRAGETPSPPGAKVYIIWPHDGAVINGGKLWVRMGARGIGVVPANIAKPKTGHYHIILNADLPPFDDEIPNDRNNLHFGAGQTEARLELPPGQHTLQLLMGDQDHVPHNPPLYSKKITITVP